MTNEVTQKGGKLQRSKKKKKKKSGWMDFLLLLLPVCCPHQKKDWMPNSDGRRTVQQFTVHTHPTNIVSVQLLLGCPNAGVKIVKKIGTLRATLEQPKFCDPLY